MPKSDASYSVMQRLRFIDILLEQGTLNRLAIVDYFGISPAQATRDIKAYLKIAPQNAHFDQHTKTYTRTLRFVRVWT